MAWLLPIHSFKFYGGDYVTGKLVTYAKCALCAATFEKGMTEVSTHGGLKAANYFAQLMTDRTRTPCPASLFSQDGV